MMWSCDFDRHMTSLLTLSLSESPTVVKWDITWLQLAILLPVPLIHAYLAIRHLSQSLVLVLLPQPLRNFSFRPQSQSSQSSLTHQTLLPADWVQAPEEGGKEGGNMSLPFYLAPHDLQVCGKCSWKYIQVIIANGGNAAVATILHNWCENPWNFCYAGVIGPGFCMHSLS